MQTLEALVSEIKADRILDVATGRGDFLHFLQENLTQFGTAVGIDIKRFEVWSKNGFDPDRIHFLEMNAMDLKFDNDSFDLVSISNSLHHMEDPVKVLLEMKRVLKSTGVFLFYEMFTDGQSPTQQTHTLLHQWWGKIDTAAGIYHHSPYKKRELTSFLNETGITSWNYLDEADLSGDPFNPELIDDLNRIIDDYQKKTKDEMLINEGELLRDRLRSTGFHSASQFFAIGRNV